MMDNVHWTIDWPNSHRRLIVITRHYLSDANLKQCQDNFFHSAAGESTKHEIWHLLLTSGLRSAALKKFSLVFQSQNFLPSPRWHPDRPHDSKTCENTDLFGCKCQQRECGPCFWGAGSSHPSDRQSVPKMQYCYLNINPLIWSQDWKRNVNL